MGTTQIIGVELGPVMFGAEIAEDTPTIAVTGSVREMPPTTGPAGGVSVHNDLSGRSVDDAHPLTAITGLVAALAGLQDDIDALGSGGLDSEAVRDAIGAALTAGTNITITVDDPGDTITIAVSGLSESIDDRVAALLTESTGIDLTYDDSGNALSIALDTTVLDERTRDTIGAALVAGDGIDITVDDTGNTITVAFSGTDASSVTLADAGGYWAAGDLETFTQEVGAALAELAATPIEPLRSVFWEFENAELGYDDSDNPNQPDGNFLASKVDEISINRNVWSSYLPGMRTANPDLFIWAYMNVGELQDTEDPGVYQGEEANPTAFLPAYAKDIAGAYVTNPAQGDNYLMRPDSSLWLADRIARALDDYLPTTDGDGLLLDVIGPGPTKWRGPSSTGSYTNAPCYQNSDGTIQSSTTTGAMTNSQTTVPVAWDSRWPASGDFDLVIYKTGDASAERVTITSGHGAANPTCKPRDVGGSPASGHTQDAVTHGSGATVCRVYRDSEWMALMATFTGAVKTGTAVPCIGNGLGSGPLYMGQFAASTPPEAATKPIIANIDGGVVENFVRDDKTGGSTPVTPRNATAWANDLAMLQDAAAAGKPLYLITKTWATGERSDPATQLKWDLYATATFLLGYYPGVRFCYVAEHHTGFTQATYENPLSDVPLGAPTGPVVTQGSGSSTVYTRQFENGFVAVNPQSASKTVTLPHAMTPYTGGSPESGGITLAAATGQIWLDDLNPTTAYASAAALQDHIDATSDAHDADAITYGGGSVADALASIPNTEAIQDIVGALLAAGTGITVTYNDAGAVETISIDTTVIDERARDALGTALTAGTGISLTVNDAGDAITIAIDTAAVDERARDAVGAALAGGDGIDIVVNDAGDTITVGFDAGSTAFGRSLLALDDAADAKSTLGLSSVFGLFGGLLGFGHSYSQIGSDGASGSTTLDTWTNLFHLLGAALNIPSEETFLYGKSGGQLCSPSAGEGVDAQGLGFVLKHIYPSQSFVLGADRPNGKAIPALAAGIYGYNEVLRNPYAAATLGATAFGHHLRTLIWRLRAGNVYDSRSSRVTFSGFGTTTSSPQPVSTSGKVLTGAAPDLAACTGPFWKISKTNAEYVEFTVPETWSGGKVGFVLVGSPGARCLLSTAINDTGATTTVVLKGSTLGDLGYKNLSAGDQILIDSERITLGSTADGGITWTGCTRAAGGTTGATHSVNAVVSLPTTTGKVTWGSSTATGASGHADTYLSGLGSSTDGVYYPTDATARRCSCFVTVLFDIPAADAGLKIRATVAGLVGNEYVGFDHVSLADPEAPPFLFFNQPDAAGTMLAGGSFYQGATLTAFESAAATVLAELTSDQVATVDVKTEIEARFKATVQTAISSTGTATLHVTPVDATKNEAAVGRTIRVLGASGIETMLITSITKTSTTDWSLGVTRNYGGGGAQTTIAVGKPVIDTDWLALDYVHPNARGHMIYAAEALDTLGTIPQTTRQIVSTGGLVSRRRGRVKHGGYLFNPGPRATLASATIGNMYLEPFEVLEPLIVIDALAEVTAAANASGTYRFGLWIDGQGEPGALVAELGTVSQGSVAVRSVAASGTPMTNGIWVPLKPGIYWRGIALQGTGTMATTRGVNTAPVRSAQYPIQAYASSALTTPFGTSSSGILGLRCTGITGALASNPTIESSVETTLPMVALQVAVPVRD